MIWLVLVFQLVLTGVTQAADYDPALAIDRSLKWMQSPSPYQQKMGAAVLRSNLVWLKQQENKGLSAADFQRIQEQATHLNAGNGQALLESLYPVRLDLALKRLLENQTKRLTDLTSPLTHLAVLHHTLPTLNRAEDFLNAVVVPIRTEDVRPGASAREWVRHVFAQKQEKAFDVTRCLLTNLFAIDFAKTEAALGDDFSSIGPALDVCARLSGESTVEVALRALSVQNSRKFSLYRWDQLSIENLLKEAHVGEMNGNLDLAKVAFTRLDVFSPSAALRKDRPDGPPSLEDLLSPLMHEIGEGHRWIAVGGGVNGVPSCTFGCSTLEPIAVEPETGWAFFSVLVTPDLKVPKVILSHTSSEGKPELIRFFENEIRSTIRAEGIPPSLIEISPRVPRPFPPLDPLEFSERVSPTDYLVYQWESAPERTAEQEAIDRMSQLLKPIEKRTPTQTEEKRHHGLFPFVKGMAAALEPSGWFLDHPDSTPVEDAAALSLARMSLMREFVLANIKLPDEPAAPVSQRARLLGHSAHIFAQALFKRYSGELGRQIQFIETVRGPVKEAHRHLEKAIADFTNLSEEDGFELLGRAADTLEIEKPDVVESKENLALCLVGAEFQLRELLATLESRKALACEMARRMEFSGTRHVPEMRLHKEARAVCGL